MIRIAICDDDEKDLLALSSLLEKFKTGHYVEKSVAYTIFSGGMDLLAAIQGGQVFDILLLDVVMPLTNGIKLAEEIRTKDKNVRIIFLSSTAAFAVDSYQVNAFHYIVKPVRQESLFGLLIKAIKSVESEQRKYIVVRNRSELIKVRFDEIHYAEIVNHTTYLHLSGGDLIKNYGSMAQLEAALCGDRRFIKPHRSYLLNMDFIESISPEGICTTEGKLIPISRNVYKEIRQAYISYSFQQ